jgi:hypothetical protein
MVRLSEKAKQTLYNWVVSTLSSFYKADKNSLATYITALVEAADAVRYSEFKQDLADFLGSHTEAFVRELIDCVKHLGDGKNDGDGSSAAVPVVISSPLELRPSVSTKGRKDDRARGGREHSRSRSRSPPSKRRTTYQPQQPPPNYAPPPVRTSGGSGPRAKADHSKTTSINVTEIPRPQCDLRLISGFFGRFGNVTACRVDPDLQRATVTYSDPAHARAAISSPIPVLNNRFIKIYWDTSNAVALADAPQHPVVASAPAAADAFLAETDTAAPAGLKAEAVPFQPAPFFVERNRLLAEEMKNQQHLRELQQQRETLRRKQLSEIASMTVMLGTSTGKKREFLMQQIEELTALVQASLKPDQERLGVGYEKQLTDTVAALEKKAGEMGLSTKMYKRKKAESGPSRVLDNRPRQLLLVGLPETATVKSVLGHFKTFGLIDEIDLESPSRVITYATHDAANKALVHGNIYKDERGIVKLALAWFSKTVDEVHAPKNTAVASSESAAPSAAPTIVVREKEEEDDEEEDDTQKNWKR